MKKLKKYEYFRTDLGVLYHGDCLEIMPLLKDKIDLIYTDPPYNFKKGGEKGFYKRDVKTLMQKLRETFGHTFNPRPFLERVDHLKNHIINMYVWTNKGLIPDYLIWGKNNNLTFNILCWHKINSPPLWSNSYCPDTEYLLFFRKKKRGVYFNSTLGGRARYKKYWLTSVKTIKDWDHPCPKPLDITFNPIEISCPPAGRVADFHVGTGTTLVACERLGRKWIGIEISEKYCEIAKGRILKESSQLKLR